MIFRNFIYRAEDRVRAFVRCRCDDYERTGDGGTEWEPHHGRHRRCSGTVSRRRRKRVAALRLLICRRRAFASKTKTACGRAGGKAYAHGGVAGERVSGEGGAVQKAAGTLWRRSLTSDFLISADKVSRRPAACK